MLRPGRQPGGQYRNAKSLNIMGEGKAHGGPVPNRRRTFVLRLDGAKMSALEKWAADEFRSINGHLEWLIHRALVDAGRLPSNQKKGTSSEAPFSDSDMEANQNP